ncbi:Oidioi.mRNA.OKI2018_I69.XSR.g15310.t1.cds [Oikopleura dioica]|uniref:Oidioi.mRNA.OKI2018_I69.XSR.g15310.t1.cds n=1 Tax=Oikopleura dioica TaxID=34765 RepID=A0ABN7SCE8_OIKDI|nr:Oidioi.mRNA.OKI2018_I69.XSR.g15310.t1.cds [Oikopleura dioica]
MRSDGFASEEYLRALSRLGLEGNLFHSKENLRKAFIELNAEVELDDVSVRNAYEYCLNFHEDMYGRSQGVVSEKIENVTKLKRSVGGISYWETLMMGTRLFFLFCVMLWYILQLMKPYVRFTSTYYMDEPESRGLFSARRYYR